MTTARFERLQALFERTVDLTPAERRQALDAECGDDAALRSEIEALLSVHAEDATPGFLEPPRAAPHRRARELRHLGRYEILRVLGEGGMGLVYEARQENPSRHVALKVLRPGLLDDAAWRRFDYEVEILGRLQHPGIAQIFDAGSEETPLGPQPYFAMELVEGETLVRYCQRRRLTLRKRLELFVGIGEAVQHAHQKGVIHRDLKPSNILVNHEGRPKVLDFGIARSTDSDVRSTTHRTKVASLLGTISYMSPEQAAGDPEEVDVRSDVYSLGVVLCELLTGELPYPLDGCKLHEAVQIIREQEPRPIGLQRRELRGDLETIVLKALEKDKERRYPSVTALVADVQRFLRDDPIQARPPGRAYLLRKFATRHKALVLGITSVFLALALGIVGTSWKAAEARRAALEAGRQSERAQENFRQALDLAGSFLAEVAGRLVASDEQLPAPLLASFRDRFRALLGGAPASMERTSLDRYREILRLLEQAGAVDGENASPALAAAAPTAPQKDPSEAHLRRVIEVAEELQGTGASTDQTQLYLLGAHERLGRRELERGHLSQARIHFRSMRELGEALVDSEAGNPEYLGCLSRALAHLADLAAREEVLASSYREELEKLESLNLMVELHPDDQVLQESLSAELGTRGQAYQRRGDVERALACLQQKRRVAGRLCEQHPERLDYRLDHVLSLALLGELHETRGPPEEARRCFEEGLELLRGLPREVSRGSDFASIGEWLHARLAGSAHAAPTEDLDPEQRTLLNQTRWSAVLSLLAAEDGEEELSREHARRSRAMVEELAARSDATPFVLASCADVLLTLPLGEAEGRIQAEKLARRAAQASDPPGPVALRVLARALAASGDLLAAIEAQEEALERLAATDALHGEMEAELDRYYRQLDLSSTPRRDS